MSTENLFNHDVLLLDACCIITLSASGILNELLTLLPCEVAVVDYVLDEEALWYHEGPDNSPRAEKRGIDLLPQINEGLIRRVELETEAEQLTFLSLAVSLDDGEAATGAVAYHRNYAIATDEKKGLRVFTEQMPHIQLITTPDLLYFWAEQTGAAFEAICQAVWNIRWKGVYIPPRQHRLFDWWNEHWNDR